MAFCQISEGSDIIMNDFEKVNSKRIFNSSTSQMTAEAPAFIFSPP